jgi:protease-4
MKMCIITPSKALKVEKRKTITKLVSLITRKMTTTGVSTDSKKSNCIIYAQGNSKWRRRCQHYRRRFYASFFAGARRNKDVKVIVLRIDSPGGSALTSDLI